jgi:hypothetical protein
MTPTVRIETGDHSGAGIFLAAGFAATGRMGVENVFLILLRLLRRQPHLGEFPHASVDAVHHFPTLDFAFQQGPALDKTGDRLRVHRYLFAVSGGSYDVFNGQRMAVQYER